MKNLNLNQFMQDVHNNAISHGWWEKPRSAGTIRSLFHAELTEALEEYRSHRPMEWKMCPHRPDAGPGPCEETCVYHWTIGGVGRCELNRMDSKPEGIAVELMDFVIRILDYLGYKNHVFAYDMCTPQTLAAWSVDDFQMDEEGSVLDKELPDFVDVLHDEISLSSVMHNETYLVTAAGLAIAWVEKRGMDPEKLLVEKHEYNKTRPYKHGGKVC